MAKKPPTIRQLAAAMCRKFPNAASRQLARMLYEENKLHIASQNAAYLAIRRCRGKQGKLSRDMKFTDVPNAPGVPLELPACPPSAAEPWLPVQIDGPCKVLCLSDIHIPYHSPKAVEAAVCYGKQQSPDVVLLNGDTCDFYRISRFQQDPKKRLLKDELVAIRQFIEWMRYSFPKSRIIFKLGNHEERWNVYLWNKAPELVGEECVELHNVLKFDQHGIERVGDSPILAGELPILHGHELGKGLYAPVNPARTAFLKMQDTVLIGHLHRSSSNAESDWQHNETVAWSQGCLCDLAPEYARVNRWNWGFAMIDVASDNQFNVHNYRINKRYDVRTA